ncbi:MAG: PH domain-containing protein [Faecalibacterium sp.]
MSRSGRYHPILMLRYLRKTLALYLLPLIRVLFERDWPAVRTALMQDLALFAALSLLSWLLLHSSSWQLDDDGALHLRWDWVLRFDRTLHPGAAAALIIERPLLFRLTGASRVTLYPAGLDKHHTVTLYLSRRDADWLADRLMPARDTVHRHSFTGGEKLTVAVLGANALSTLALLMLAVRESKEVAANAHTLAWMQLNYAADLAARWLPVGAAWLLVLGGFVLGISLLRSAGQTAQYTVWRTPEMLCSRGGLVRRWECRVRRSQISYADVRVSPVSLLLHRFPVFVTAGCFAEELPLMVYHPGEQTLLEQLLPGFRFPPKGRSRTRRRSLIFFAPAGAFFGLCVLLAVVASYTLPTLTPALVLMTGVGLVFLAAAAVGYFWEGVWVQDGRLTLRRQKRLNLHCLCVFHPDITLTVRQSPWAVMAQRANLILAFPGRVRYKVRSVPLENASACMSAMESGMRPEP